MLKAKGKTLDTVERLNRQKLISGRKSKREMWKTELWSESASTVQMSQDPEVDSSYALRGRKGRQHE